MLPAAVAETEISATSESVLQAEAMPAVPEPAVDGDATATCDAAQEISEEKEDEVEAPEARSATRFNLSNMLLLAILTNRVNPDHCEWTKILLDSSWIQHKKHVKHNNE